MGSADLTREFAKAIRRRRIAAGLSQETLAESAGLHPTYIGLIERGERKPTLHAGARIADALGVALSEIIREAERALGSKGKR